jgi:hypothetical protein
VYHCCVAMRISSHTLCFLIYNICLLNSALILFFRHADGSIKFWDASAGTLQVLYKLKTAKVFEKPRSKSVDGVDEDPFAIQFISLCPESRKLCVAGASSHVVLFKFRKLESVSETAVSLSQSKGMKCQNRYCGKSSSFLCYTNCKL